MMRRFIQYFGFLVAALVVLAATLILFSQTRIFKNWLRIALVNQANANLNARLSVGTIRGNLWRNFEISDLLLVSASDTILTLESIQVNFAPIGLIHKQLVVQALQLETPCVRLKQMPDSTWNFTRLVKTGKTEPDRTRKPDWRFRFQNVRLNQGSIKILPLVPTQFLPDHIREIEAKMSLDLCQDTLRARLKHLSLRSLQPDLTIDDLAFDFSLQRNRLLCRNLALATEKSIITGHATLALAPGDSAALVLVARPLDFSEIRSFVPALPPLQPAEVNLAVDYRADTLQVTSQMAMNGQSLRFFGQANNLAQSPNYAVVADLVQVQVSDWIADPALNFLLNGQIRLTGAGATGADAVLYLESDLAGCHILTRPINAAAVVADYRSGRLSSRATMQSLFGRLVLDGWLELNESQRFRIAATGEKIDLARLFLNDSLKSELNFRFESQGQGLALQRLNAQANLQLVRSRILRLPVDTLFSRIGAKQGTFFIDTLYARTAPALLHGSGTVNTQLDYQLQLNGEFVALDWLKALTPADSLNGRGRIHTRINGHKDSLVAETDFNFSRIFYNTMQADSVTGSFYAIYQDSLNGSAQAQLKNIKFGQFPVNEIKIQSIFRPNDFTFFMDLDQSPAINGHLQARLWPDSISTLRLPEVWLNINNSQWVGDSAGAELRFAGEHYWLNNVCLRSGPQAIRLNGSLALASGNDLTLEISQLNLEPFLGLVTAPLLQKAQLDLAAHLGGTMAGPELNGTFALSAGRFKGLDFDRLNAHFAYADQQLNWQLKLRQNKMHGLESDGFVPINLSLAETSQRFNYEKPLQVRITLDTLDLATLESFSEQVRFQGGTAYGRLNIENTLKNFRPVGEFIVSGAELKVPPYGVHYKDIHMTVKVDSAQIVLENFRTKSERGFLTATGFVDFERNILAGVFKSTQVKLSANQFALVNNRNYQATLGADLHLTGPVLAPQLDGKIQVLRSRLYLPAFMTSGAAEDEWAQPLLVQTRPDSMPMAKRPTELSVPDLLNNLKVNTSIEIPKNTWLKSPEINLEIAGDLTVIKRQRSNFELFGTIRVLRGTYDLYGKRFSIKNGNFSFEGGPEYNPNLDLEASHVFRAANAEKKTLTLLLSGKALNPTIKFTLDDAEISEGNAIAYLVLGRSLDELTHSERSTLAQESGFNPGSAASSILTSLVANEVSKLIGSRLNLDVIEFKGEENWQQATFVIGKYLTNDLFFSYQKEFSTSQSNEIVPVQVTLEYEINRNLFLQLTKGSEKNTGFDLIFKLQK